MPVRDEGRTLESSPGAQPDTGREFVARKADNTSHDQNRKVREVLRMDESGDCFNPSNGRGGEDRQHDGIARPPFPAVALQPERDPERDGGERITGVVNQVGEQCDRPRQGEHKNLQRGRHTEDGEAPKHSAHTVTGAHDRRVDASMRISVPMTMTMTMIVVMCAIPVVPHRSLNRADRQTNVTMRTVRVMFVLPEPMSVSDRMMHAPTIRADAYRYGAGFTGLPSSRTSKWRCGPVE